MVSEIMQRWYVTRRATDDDDDADTASVLNLDSKTSPLHPLSILYFLHNTVSMCFCLFFTA